jgi:hypothetical protein
MGVGEFLVLAATLCAVVGFVLAAAWAARRRFRASFGAEHALLTRRLGSRRAADRELARRTKIYSSLPDVPLSPEDLQYYTESWDRIRGGLDADPAAALAGAERLLRALIHDRGYPCHDPEEQLALLSVRHGRTLPGYRAAQRTSQSLRRDAHSVPIEELRQAFASYHVLFDELLMDADDVPRRLRRVPAHLPGDDFAGPRPTLF